MELSTLFKNVFIFSWLYHKQLKPCYVNQYSRNIMLCIQHTHNEFSTNCNLLSLNVTVNLHMNTMTISENG